MRTHNSAHVCCFYLIQGSVYGYRGTVDVKLDRGAYLGQDIIYNAHGRLAFTIYSRNPPSNLIIPPKLDRDFLMLLFMKLSSRFDQAVVKTVLSWFFIFNWVHSGDAQRRLELQGDGHGCEVTRRSVKKVLGLSFAETPEQCCLPHGYWRHPAVQLSFMDQTLWTSAIIFC